MLFKYCDMDRCAVDMVRLIVPNGAPEGDPGAARGESSEPWSASTCPPRGWAWAWAGLVITAKLSMDEVRRVWPRASELADRPTPWRERSEAE